MHLIVWMGLDVGNICTIRILGTISGFFYFVRYLFGLLGLCHLLQIIWCCHPMWLDSINDIGQSCFLSDPFFSFFIPNIALFHCFFFGIPLIYCQVSVAFRNHKWNALHKEFLGRTFDHFTWERIFVYEWPLAKYFFWPIFGPKHHIPPYPPKIDELMLYFII